MQVAPPAPPPAHKKTTANPNWNHRRSWPNRIARPGRGRSNYFFAFFATFFTAFFTGFFAAFLATFFAIVHFPPFCLTLNGGQVILEVVHGNIVLCFVFA